VAVKAAILRRYGPPDAIEIGEVPAPIPGRGQLLIRVHASSLNPLDVKLRSGAFRRLMPLKFPAVLGFDVAGTVEHLGPGVAGWSPGERVYGRTDARTGGTHAELTVVGVNAIDRIPGSLSFEGAASLPLVALTTLQAFEQIRLAAGERLLVNGAAGGVGSVAVQVGRALGAIVTGVTTGGGVPVVSRLGVQVLDYSTGGLARTAERFDVILDTVFDGPTPELLRVLAGRGRYVTTGFSPGLVLRNTVGRLITGRRFGFVISRADGNRLRRVSEMVAAGQLAPVVDSVFPLERIVEAYARLESGHMRGKVAIRHLATS
jgi:NADPH:quinone reductase-like Zn-dependent oxidoreductase